MSDFHVLVSIDLQNVASFLINNQPSGHVPPIKGQVVQGIGIVEERHKFLYSGIVGQSFKG